MDFFLSPLSIAFLLALFFIGAVGSLFLSRFLHDQGRWAGYFAHGTALAGSLLALFIVSDVLLSGQGIVFTLPSIVPDILSFNFRLDGLAAFFLGVIAVVAGAASLYGFSYQKHFYGKYDLGLFGFFYNIFVASVMLVTLANQALFFLLVWESMSLTSYFLIIYEYRKKENIQAGFLYFLMTHFGTLLIMLAFFRPIGLRDHLTSMRGVPLPVLSRQTYRCSFFLSFFSVSASRQGLSRSIFGFRELIRLLRRMFPRFFLVS